MACHERLDGPTMKVAEGNLKKGLITDGNRLMTFVDIVFLQDLPTVKHQIGCRLNGANGCRLHFAESMGKGR